MLYDELVECSFDELIGIVVDQLYYIEELENKIKELEKEHSNKINKDFEDNKKMVGELINCVAKSVCN